METEEAVRSIGESFERIALAARRAARSAAAQLDPDLQAGSFAVFREVVREGRVQPHSLAATLNLDRSAVSRHLKDLRERGLVTTERDEHDARALWVSAAPEAVARYEAGVDRRRAVLHERLATWAPDDLERFSVLLDRFAEPEWLRRS